MSSHIDVEPLPYKTRQRTFGLLLFVFIVSLPFLYIYATGYRFDFAKPSALVSTGGIYVAADRAGASIYIDDELVRETRTFRKAFYAQSLDAGTHRVHVQKEGYHTWVKELPVSKHLVTEAEAFNLPITPQVRVISKWQSATGSMVMKAPLMSASSTNEVIATTTTSTTTFSINDEYATLILNFATTSTSTLKESTAQQIKDLLHVNATSTQDVDESTTTIISGGAKIYERDGDVYATWIGSFEDMPYYYCAPAFPPYSAPTTTLEEEAFKAELVTAVEEGSEGDIETMQPVQTIPKDAVCDPTILIDRKWQDVHDFDFFPGGTDFVIMVLIDGVYVVEVDNRSWQNVQPLFMGKNLEVYVEGGNIYVFDGVLIYQVMIQTS